MVTKLQVFNGALREIGDRRVVDTGEASEAAREIVTVYDQVVAECLVAGSWNFATETIKATADTGVTPNFGFSEVFAKPSDWVKTVGVSEDENLSIPLTRYYDDSNFWSADSSPIYIRYVSNDTGMGRDLTRWPALFTRYVELELAARVCRRLGAGEETSDIIKRDRDKAKRTALNFDAMNEAQPKFLPMGSWNRSRGGGSRNDRGSRGTLIG